MKSKHAGFRIDTGDHHVLDVGEAAEGRIAGVAYSCGQRGRYNLVHLYTEAGPFSFRATRDVCVAADAARDLNPDAQVRFTFVGEEVQSNGTRKRVFAMRSVQKSTSSLAAPGGDATSKGNRDLPCPPTSMSPPP